MFSEVVKLIPNVDRASLNRMFQTLNQRFATVAKKFAAGMKNAFKFGGLVGIGASLISKMLNPLQKAEEIINRITGKGDDAVTNAEEFGTEAGKILRLEAIGAAKGVDSDTMRTLLGKFQSALAEEQQLAKDPNAKPGTLREFVGEKDTADAFFKFIQSLGNLGRKDKTRQTLIENEIFGEKLRGKASEFINAPSQDFEDILNKLPTVEELTAAAQKSGSLADMSDLLKAIRESQDFVRKSGLVKESQIKAIDQSERQKLKSEDQTLQRFDSLKSSSIAIQELTEKFDAMATSLLKELAPKLIESINGLTLIFTALQPVILEAKDLLMTGFDRTIQAIGDISTMASTLWAEFKGSALYKFGGRLFGGK